MLGDVAHIVILTNTSKLCIRKAIVPDEKEAIQAAFNRADTADVIISTGGTGLSARDITPEATSEYCDRLVPGIAEYLRAESLKETTSAILSRWVAGQKGKTLIINVPGSVRGAKFCAEKLAPVLTHAIKMMHGEAH